VSQCASDAGERYAGIAAGRLDDEVARLEQAALVAAAYDVQRHAVLYTAGHVEILGLAVKDAPLPTKTKLHGQHGGVTHQAREAIEAAFDVGDEQWKPPGIMIRRWRLQQSRESQTAST